jgi:hypothetical protein
MRGSDTICENIAIDPEIQSLIPPLSPEELSGLEENIKLNGCRDAIVLWDTNGIILDGHNRYAICTRHDIEFKTVEMSFEDKDHAKLWVIRNQLDRRNLAAIDRIGLIAGHRELEERIREEAKEKQRQAGFEKLPQNSAEAIETRQELASLAGVSHDTYTKARNILEAVRTGKGAPELIQAISNKDISINAAHAILSLPPEKQAIVVRKGEKTVINAGKALKKKADREEREKERSERAARARFNIPEDDDRGVKLNDFRDVAKSIEDNSIDLIFTDPPYDKETLPLLVISQKSRLGFSSQVEV